MSDIEASLDTAIESVAEELIASDPEIRGHIKLLVVRSLKVKLHYLENGTPDVKLRAASSLDPFIKMALTPKKEETDEQVNKVYEEARRMIMNVIPVDEDMEEIGEEGEETG